MFANGLEYDFLHLNVWSGDRFTAVGTQLNERWRKRLYIVSLLCCDIMRYPTITAYLFLFAYRLRSQNALGQRSQDTWDSQQQADGKVRLMGFKSAHEKGSG